MNKYIITGTVAAIAILAAFFGFSKYFGAAPQLAGGVVAADRMNYSTIDGNTGSTTASVIGGAFVSPTATSTLIAGVSDIDALTFFGSTVGSSSNMTVGVSFYESMDTTCNTNSASSTWYAMNVIQAPATSTMQLASSTTYTFSGYTGAMGSFDFNVPFAPAQCIKANVFPVAGSGNFQIWYGFGASRQGYSIPN